MAIRADERKNYNRAVRDTNALIKTMENSFKAVGIHIGNLIAVYRQKEITTPTEEGSARRIKRVADLNKEIKDIIRDLTSSNRKLVKRAYIKEWNDSYLNTAFDVEKEVNLVTLQGNNGN